MATGSATVDGKPYLGHESFDEFWSGQYFNICKRVEPDDGYAFIMQASAPCMLVVHDRLLRDRRGPEHH